MDELKKAISGNALAPLYILYGEESYLLEHYLGLMHKGVADFDYRRLDGLNSTIREVAEAAQALPMSGERVFVEVRDMDFFERGFGESSASTLEELVADVPETCRLVFAYSAVEFKPDKRRKLWKTLEKCAKIVEFKYQSESALAAWVERHFSAEQKRISRQNAAFLVRYCGRSMSTLAGEVAKLAAYSSGAEVTESDIRAVTSPQLEAGVFECADAIIRGDPNSASRMFGTLLEMHKDALRDEAIPLIAALSWKLRREFQSRVRYGGRSPMLDWSADAILLCADADVRCKSSSGEPREILTQLFTLLLAKRGMAR